MQRESDIERIHKDGSVMHGGNHIVFCVDRGGLVGDDGPTHHGSFDVSYLLAVPNITIMVPRDGNELRAMLNAAATRELDGPCAIRYPRASVPDELKPGFEPIEWGTWEKIYEVGDIALIAAGTMVETARLVREKLKDKIRIALINARFIKPMDFETLNMCMAQYNNIFTLEENALAGGMGQTIGAYLKEKDYPGNFHAFGLPDKFVTHGKRDILLTEIGLDADSIAEYIEKVSNIANYTPGKITFRKNAVEKVYNRNRVANRRTASGRE